ncbi:hypothetical protein [Halalkalibacter oceani]|uniref:hypothetical protein n=1 Tax=Halalkalibacter oceani TaxID=1653776 RepID=UPI003398D41C
MKVNILNDMQMRELSFTEYRKGYWHYCKTVEEDITFNLTVKKEDSSFKIDVLDENFLQPYDYQYYLSQDPNFKFALTVKDKVEKIMLDLTEKGIVENYTAGEYI